VTRGRLVATSGRVLRQLRHDPRTIALLLVVPVVLMSILAWILTAAQFDQWAPPLLGIFPLIVMFLVTSVATLRERSSGTLERLLTMPMSKPDFVLGYALAFGLLAIIQGLVVSAVCFGLLGLDVAGSAWLVVLVAVADGLLGTALGLFVSAFATTEFQAVQFMPAVLLPQLLLCGLIVPRDEMPTVARWISNVIPLSYSISALQRVSGDATVTWGFWADLLVVAGFAIVLLLLGAATLRRRTP
jgi:ABC-2 type transport system permease protein